MDNHFVPNLTIGLPVVEALLKATTLPMDCHLMIEDPDRWAPGYAEAGAASVTFHVEAASAPIAAARDPAPRGPAPGWRSTRAPPSSRTPTCWPRSTCCCVMTVEPGFGGQQFLDVVLPKMRRARELIKARRLDVWLQVDGGVNARDHRTLRRGRARTCSSRARRCTPPTTPPRPSASLRGLGS